MARRKILTDEQIAKLAPRSSAYPDPELAGHYIRVRPTGRRVFCVVARDPNGKQVWHTLGDGSVYNVAEARAAAREAIKAIKTGTSRSGVETFASVAEQWVKRHVEAKGLISAVEYYRYLNRVLIPAWGGREFASIKRSDVAKLLDEAEDKNGPVAADFILAIIRGICNWYAKRTDDYNSPIVRGMRAKHARARSRSLEDDELRTLWNSADGVFGAFIRIALLTGQRRAKIRSMRWQDIVDGEWRIPSSEREKNTAGALVLPQAALDIINAQPRFASNPYVFAGIGGNYFGGMSRRKAAFEAKIKIAPWSIHDLRRTARSLMS